MSKNLNRLYILITALVNSLLCYVNHFSFKGYVATLFAFLVYGWVFAQIKKGIAKYGDSSAKVA